MITTKHILLTIDVEDWFQVENFKPWIPFETWDQRELRVEKNVHKLLDLFDESAVRGQKTEDRNQSSDFRGQKKTEQKKYPQNPVYPVRKNKIKATFFILGWLADRLPKLVREIQSRGHEIASHGYNHELPELLSTDELKQDLNNSKMLLEDITGASVFGYRAPSFAVNDDILKIIEDTGYLYDSSYNSFGLHGRYGKISLNGTRKKGIAHQLSDNFYELPISNLKLFNKVLPLGGGGYFRLTPYRLFRLGVEQILKNDDAYVFYMHPWELDPEQPKIHQASFNLRFRHYSNLSKTHDRLKQLIKSFNNCAFITCTEYLTACA